MDSFEQVYKLYFKDVYRYILSLCRDVAQAEEITQETFFRAMKNMSSFRGDCKMTVWLCQIAKNIYFSDQKKQSRRLRQLQGSAGPQGGLFEAYATPGQAVGGTPSVEARLSDEADAMQIHEILHQMEEPYKEVFMLRVFGELPFKKIARIFGKSESWARVTYHRARLRLIREMEECNGKDYM